MTQIGLHSYIRVTKGIMICVAKANAYSNIAAHLHDKSAETDLFSYDEV